MNVIVYIMYIIYVMWMVAFLAGVSSKPTVEIGTDVVAEILRAIGGREDMQRVGRYLSASRDHLVKELPLLTSGMKKYTSYGIYYICYCKLQRKSSRALFCCENYIDGIKIRYTFFAPTGFALMIQTPQDTVDPLVVDASLRNKVLIRHFARQSVSSDDLAKLDKLVMADSRESVITRTAG